MTFPHSMAWRLCSVALVAMSACDWSRDAARPFDAIEMLRRGEATSESEVAIGSIPAYGDTYFVIYGVGPNRIDFPVTIPDHAALRVGYTVVPTFLEEDFSEGARPVEFAVEFEPTGGEPVRLLEEVVDIRSRPQDRRWHRVRLDLSQHAGQRGRLRFSNGDGGRVPIAWGRPTLFDAVAAGDRPNLLLIIVDALRADHLASYGYRRPTSPSMDALARSGIRYIAAFTNAPMTIPSVPQVLTSRYAPRFGDPTLATQLAAAGVPVTRALVNNHWIRYWLTLRGRDNFDTVTGGLRMADAVTDTALDWIDEVPAGDGFALYVHYLDVHAPYIVPEEYASHFVDPSYDGEIGLTFDDIERAKANRFTQSDRQRIIDLYDGSIRYVDEHIGRLLDGLAERDLLDATLVILTSDHGEELFDRGSFFHGQSLYDEQLRVPLLVRLPGSPGAGAGTVVDQMVRTLDIVPTIADVLGLPPIEDQQGESLLGRGGDPNAIQDREVFARAANPSLPLRFALRTRDYKLVVTARDGREDLYHVASDSHERRSARGAPEHEEALDRLRERLDTYRQDIGRYGFHVRAKAGDGRTHRIDLRIQSSMRMADPDRIALPTGDRIILSGDQRRLRWVGTLGPDERGFRFDVVGGVSEVRSRDDLMRNGIGVLQRLDVPMPDVFGVGDREMKFQIVVDGAPLPADAIHLGDGSRAQSSPFLYTGDPPVLQTEIPPALDATGAPVAVAIWHSGGGQPGADVRRALSPEEREQLRALGYAE
jgi:arylsulfatase